MEKLFGQKSSCLELMALSNVRSTILYWVFVISDFEGDADMV